MKTIVKIICCIATLSWISGAIAGGVVIHENADVIILESTSDLTPASATPVSKKTPVKAYYDKVDRTKAEQRLEANALRAKRRTAEAQKDAAERAAKTQQEQVNQSSRK